MNRKVSRRVLARVVATKLLSEPARRNHWLQALAAFLLEHKMVDDADLVLNDIAHEIFAQSGELLVDVTSARPLTDAVRKELAHYLKQATDARQVVLTEHTDKSLIGGFTARTPDQELDTSIRTQLQQLATIR